MRALLSVDYTYDFVATDGKLTTGEPGQAIENKIVSLTNQFIEEGSYVVFAIDCHEPDDSYHPENELFPAHNVAGTKGRSLYGGLEELYEGNKNKETVYWINKRHYSAFSGTDLDIRLRERNITEIHLTGVCTDICVLHTAIDAYNLGYQMVIHKDAVASFNAIGHEWALDHFENTLGATIL